MKKRENPAVTNEQGDIQFVAPAFAVFAGFFAASLHPRFAPIIADIGLARDAQIRSRINSPKFRDPVKYPG